MKTLFTFLLLVTTGFGGFAQTFKTGSKIEVDFGGTWYKGTILEVKGDQYNVRYEGPGETFDSWLPKTRIRTIGAAESNIKTTSKPLTVIAAGSKVEILWSSSWYKGSVLEVKDDKYKIHYDGYGENWDTWVTKDQLRLPGINDNVTPKNNDNIAPKNNEQRVVKNTPKVNAAAYKDASGKLYFRTFMWMGAYGSSLDISWIYLGNNGSILRNPKHGVNPVDFAAELTDNAENVGKYKITGNKLNITWSNGTPTSWGTESSGGELSAIDGGLLSRPAAMPVNYRLSGQYAASAVMPNVSAVQTFVFNNNGTFTLNKFGAVHTNDMSDQSESTIKGTYKITGNTLWLNFDNGDKQVATIYIWDMAAGKKHLVINTSSFPQEK